jgi:transposase
VKENFRQVDRQTLFLMPPSLDDWLPRDHLARFIVEVVAKLDLRSLIARYEGRGIAAYHPEMMVALLFYGYATGVMSSRRLEAATYDSVAFRFIAANSHPDHDTIATFRQRFFAEIRAVFTQILLVAQENKLLKVGTVNLDGTKIKANASKHKAMSLGRAKRLREQIEAEVDELLERAKQADNEDSDDGLRIPEELVRREDRLRKIDEATKRIEERERERIATEEREVSEGLREPSEVDGEIRDSAQLNFTDSQSRIMPTGKDRFEQAYNAQAACDPSGYIIVASVSQRSNDKRLLARTLGATQQLPPELGSVLEIVADAGYCSERNAQWCEMLDVTPYLSTHRERRYGLDRFSPAQALGPEASAVDRMRERLRTQEGRAKYAKRKTTIEPVFGTIKSVMGYRQTLMRGLQKVEGEWRLVCAAFNLRKMHRALCA